MRHGGSLAPEQHCRMSAAGRGDNGTTKGRYACQWILNSKPLSTAREERLNAIERIIALWEELPSFLVMRSFERAIPRNTVVEV